MFCNAFCNRISLIIGNNNRELQRDTEIGWTDYEKYQYLRSKDSKSAELYLAGKRHLDRREEGAEFPKRAGISGALDEGDIEAEGGNHEK